MRYAIWVVLSLLAAGCGGDTSEADTSDTFDDGSDADAGADGDADADADADADSDADADGGADADADADADGDADADAEHLVISEVAVAPAGGEFVEIWNRSADAVALGHCYLSDDSGYYGIALGRPWGPAGTPETDFLAQFPADATIGPDAVLVIQAAAGDFSSTYGRCPDYALAAAGVGCDGGTVPPMVAPAGGGIGTAAGSLLGNDREMLVLFCWDGTSSTVRDVDYVTWGTEYDDATRVDKSAVAGYEADTARAAQLPAAAPPPTRSIARCSADEPGEATSGGNGSSGHDETSEDLATAFEVLVTPTPGESACEDPGGGAG